MYEVVTRDMMTESMRYMLVIVHIGLQGTVCVRVGICNEQCVTDVVEFVLSGTYGNPVMVHLHENKGKKSYSQPRERNQQFFFHHHGKRHGLNKYVINPFNMTLFV
jgi:hypothetical protein